MKYIIATIKERDKEYNRTYNRLIELGVDKDDIIIDYGFKPCDIPHLKEKYHIHLYRFLFSICPMIVKLNTDIFYLEDNVYPTEIVDISNKNNINWLGYIFNQSHFICGTKYLYIPLNVIKDINKNKYKYRLTHIDNFIRKYALKKKILTIDKNYIKLYRSDTCWGTPNQRRKKQKRKEKLFIN